MLLHGVLNERDEMVSTMPCVLAMSKEQGGLDCSTTHEPDLKSVNYES